jgi:hypothetical protein
MVQTNEAANPGRAFRWLALLLGAAVLCLYVFASIVVVRWGPVTSEPGWTASRSQGNWYVRTVVSDGPAGAKLQPGDRILAMNGDPRFGQMDPLLPLQFLSPDQAYSVRVLRGGSELEVPIDSPQRRERINLAWFVSLFLAGATFYIVALLMGLLRPGFVTTRLGCIAALVTAVHIAGLILRPASVFLSTAGRVVFTMANCVAPWHLALGYEFFSKFPSPVPEDHGSRFTRAFILIYCFLLFLPRTILNFAMTLGEPFAVDFHLRHSGWIGLYQEHVQLLEGIFKVVVPIAVCAVLFRNYRLLADQPDQRRRVKWVAAAAAFGIVLPAVFALGKAAFADTDLPQSGSYPLNIIVTNLVSAIIPATLAYAVIKHRVFGINVVIRRGIQYLLAKNFLRMLLLLPLLAISLNVISHPQRTVAEIVLRSSVYSYGFLLISAAISLKYRRHLSGWIDRKFFREAYDREQMLVDLIERVKQAESVSEVSTMVATQVKAALHPTSVHVLCRRADTELFTPIYSSADRNLENETAEHTGFLLPLDARRTIDFLPERSPFPKQITDSLERLGARLIVPLRDSRQRLVGLLLLGDKKSEEPYTSSDRNLLLAIGAQMALAFDLVWLKEHAESEEQLKERALALLDQQELNLARECPKCGACYDKDAQICPADESKLATLLLERVIAGKYRIQRKIGSGGHGAVYDAWDLGLKRRVAVKVVSGSLLSSKSSFRRFEREAQASARLNHRNIVTVYDYGVAKPDGAFLCMELIEGQTWRSELRRLGALPAQLAADWLDQLLAGVAAAHEQGVIHRDLKPENVLISPEQGTSGLIKVLDFGLAKLRLVNFSDPDSLTLAGTVIGTLGYMSPEQFTAGEIDERSDIFSLGVMTVEALTGRRPFEGQSAGEVLKSLLQKSVQFNGESRDTKDLNRILRLCLAKDARSRYRFVRDMQAELIPALRNCRSEFALRLGQNEQARTISLGG